MTGHRATARSAAAKAACIFMACLCVFPLRVRGEEMEPAKSLKAIEADPAKALEVFEAKIRENPKDPTPFHRKAQAMMKLGKRNEGYAVAKEAMEKFKAAGWNLAWMRLESIPLEKVRVDVHFNMGQDERDPPQFGILRPLSFRIWSIGPDESIKEIIDFEIAMTDGKPSTAALGIERGQANGGLLTLLKPENSYTEIREAALKLIKQRHEGAKEAE
ncbi:MAG: hypothetical protein ABSE73_04895 [Planctomycetota bacterium]